MSSPGKYETITINETLIPFEIHRKSRRSITLRITSKGVLRISAPKEVGFKEIHRILRKREQWILSNLEQMRKHQAESAERIMFHGQNFRIMVTEKKRPRRVMFFPDKGEIIISTYNTDAPPESILIKKIRREAAKYLHQRVRELSRKSGIPYEKVSVRDQKTRWGSSSGKGTISLNWRSVMMPGDISDYLILHELAHQMHHNHSDNYWEFLKKLCPEYKKYDRCLRDHSHLLTLFREK